MIAVARRQEARVLTDRTGARWRLWPAAPDLRERGLEPGHEACSERRIVATSGQRRPLEHAAAWRAQQATDMAKA